MYRILTASKDTYITNKIIGSSLRATDANVGSAGTLDLFKLYDESTLLGEENPTELSRILIKFDLSQLQNLTASSLDISHSSFNCILKLTDVYGGQTVPKNFKIIALPLSKSFDEGFGRDLAQFQDLDSANFITASSGAGIVEWVKPGADSQGLLKSNDIDVITSGVLDGSVGIVSLSSEQIFASGEEDLVLDITTVISATLAGIIPDNGFRISFTGSQETDTQSRFVKRFASRHSTNPSIRPRIEVKFNDAIQDDHENFYFDLTGSLFLNNYHRGTPSNILSGTSATQIIGTDSLLVRLISGTFSSAFTASQHSVGTNFVDGIYSATFAINSQEPLLKAQIQNKGYATFTEVWTSLDETVPFLSGTLVINGVNRTSFSSTQRRLIVSVTNSRSVYKSFEKARFRVFAMDTSVDDDFKVTKLPIESTSEIFRDMHFRVRDAHSGDIIIPFDESRNSTVMSTDSNGMYFEMYMDSFAKGRVYEFDVLVKDRGVDQVYTSVGGRFKVEA